MTQATSPPSSPSTSPTMVELREYFECPICLCVPRSPPIFQCLSGHLICSDCRPQINVCPICRAPLGSNSRLVFAERLLEERIALPCRYCDSGCAEELLSRDLARHERDCPHRPTKCPHRGCPASTTHARSAVHAAECLHRATDCPMEGCDARIVYKDLGRHIEVAHVRPAAVGNLLYLIPHELTYGKGRAVASVALFILLVAVVYQLVLQPFPYNAGGRFLDL